MATVAATAQDMGRPLNRSSTEEAVVRLLTHIGEDPARDGLRDTPRWVVKALVEMTRGYQDDPADILKTAFAESHDQMIVLRGVHFTSLCEHYLLPFVGTATVGYVPGERVVGLSKLARLVECYARRLQIQERMTDQIATALMDHAGALGAGVIVRGHHSCMGCRGVRQASAEMVTSAMLGVMRDKPEARMELMELANG